VVSRDGVAIMPTFPPAAMQGGPELRSEGNT